MEARYFLSADAVLSVQNGQAVGAGTVLARIPVETSKTRDITGGHHVLKNCLKLVSLRLCDYL